METTASRKLKKSKRQIFSKMQFGILGTFWTLAQIREISASFPNQTYKNRPQISFSFLTCKFHTV